MELVVVAAQSLHILVVKAVWLQYVAIVEFESFNDVNVISNSSFVFLKSTQTKLKASEKAGQKKPICNEWDCVLYVLPGSEGEEGTPPGHVIRARANPTPGTYASSFHSKFNKWYFPQGWDVQRDAAAIKKCMYVRT